MNTISRQNIDAFSIMVKIIFICIFVLPVYFLHDVGFNLDQYIFALSILIYYANYVFKVGNIKIKDLIILTIIIYFCVIHQTLTHIHLIELLVIDKMLNNKKKIVKNIYNTSLLYLSLSFVFLYTLIYFGNEGRYMFTGVKEVNQSGLALILLFLIIKKKNNILGNLLLILGLLTFSKSYFLGLLLFFLMNIVIKYNFFYKLLLFLKLRSFKVIGLYTIIVLLLLASYFSHLYNLGKLENYAQGFQRFFVLTDYSNYFRFTVNGNLIKLYQMYPQKLLTGFNTEEFIYKYNLELTRSEGQGFRAVKPHNYFFSYMQIYGIFSLIIFWYLSTLFRKVVVKENLPIFLIIVSYITFLGMGVASYWLFLSMFTILVYDEALIKKDKY